MDNRLTARANDELGAETMDHARRFTMRRRSRSALLALLIIASAASVDAQVVQEYVTGLIG
ncbi:MAG TPA: hypothetical protein VNJ02_14920, partial [Vicinamibacterales bacterium]|nr:hypothetical protein [Vicinamibacterales bacterium]